MEVQPVETTIYSLSSAPPVPAPDADRRDGERHMTLYRVGSIQVEDRRELCLIKNISAGGMMIRLYCALAEGTPLTVELKNGQPITGKISWVRDHHAGISFDRPVDVIDILSSAMGGPRQRMPRIEANCHATLREGATALRVRVRDISQGGVKIQSETILAPGTDVVISLPGLDARRGIACWSEDGFIGINFNRLIPLAALVAWLQDQHERQRSAS